MKDLIYYNVLAVNFSKKKRQKGVVFVKEIFEQKSLVFHEVADFFVCPNPWNILFFTRSFSVGRESDNWSCFQPTMWWMQYLLNCSKIKDKRLHFLVV
jgi:hypothetical protein